MPQHDIQYLQLMEDVLRNGKERDDRTGTGTIGVFGRDMDFMLEDGSVPLLTTKKVHQPSIIHELIWYISGSSNIKYLQDNGVRIWNEWADSNGDLGPVYGQQWRRTPKVVGAKINYETDPSTPEVLYEYIDQLGEAIEAIKHNPTSRRIIVDAWNVAYLDEMKLPPCHFVFQFYVEDDYLSLKLTQRSCDVFLGVPFNIAQYSTLLHMVAHVTGKKAKSFKWSGGDVHIYKDHIDQCELQLSRTPYNSPKIWLNPNIKNIDDFTADDIKFIDYQCHPGIKAKVSV